MSLAGATPLTLAPPPASIAGIVFGVLAAPIILFLLLARFGTTFPRLGRWMDGRIYSVLPRLGHMFLSEEEVREQGTKAARPPAGLPDGADAARESAEDAFGDRRR